MAVIQKDKTVKCKGRVGGQSTEYTGCHKGVDPCVLRENRAEHEDAKHYSHYKTTKEVYKEYSKRKCVRKMVGDVVVNDIAQ
jgi:hypothetical protein